MEGPHLPSGTWHLLSTKPHPSSSKWHLFSATSLLPAGKSHLFSATSHLFSATSHLFSATSQRVASQTNEGGVGDSPRAYAREMNATRDVQLSFLITGMESQIVTIPVR